MATEGTGQRIMGICN